MVLQTVKAAIKFLGLTFCTMLLLACGGSGGSEESGDNVAETAQLDGGITLTGRAVKGVISSGLVNVYPLIEQRGRWVPSSTALTVPVRTDAQGYYRVKVPSRYVGQQLLVDITADEQTQMTCEVVSGCAGDVNAQFGEQFGLQPGFSLSAVSPALELTGDNSVNVTPFAHMARVRAEVSAFGISPEMMQIAVAEVQAMLSLDPESLSLEPIDITNENELGAASIQQLELALLSAAIQKAESNLGFSGIEDVLRDIEEQLAQHESLVLSDNGLDAVVAIDDLMYDAQQVLGDLNATQGVIDPAMFASLVEDLEAAQQDAFNEASLVTPVQITSQPLSATLVTGNTFTLSVGVLGGGSLSFRWYKDGAVIEGAIDSFLTIQSATQDDSASYMVRVSNSVGSVTSIPAVIEVEQLPAVMRDISLSWEIPLEREDGTPLELYEIDGYKIAYGTSASQLDTFVSVTGAAVTDYMFSSLLAGVYYFAIATIDSDGVQGRYSEPVQVVVN